MPEAPDRKPLIWMGRSRKDIGEFPDLVKGRLTELTIENLFRYLNILGRDLEIVLKPRSASSSKGKLKVTVI